MRLFDLFKGTHWTLLAYEANRAALPPRRGLHIRHIGERGDIIDHAGHVRDIYVLGPGDWVLVRPDGYIATILASAEMAMLQRYLEEVGLGQPEQAHP